MAVVEVTDPQLLAEVRNISVAMVVVLRNLKRLDDNMDLLYNAMIPPGVRPLPTPGSAAMAALPSPPNALVTLGDVLRERVNGTVNP